MRRTPHKVKMVSMSHCFNEMRAYPWGQALIFFRHHRHACLISSSKSAWRWARSSASSTHKLALCLQSHLVKIKMKIESKLLINIYIILGEFDNPEMILTIWQDDNMTMYADLHYKNCTVSRCKFNIFLTHKQIFRVKNIDNLKQTMCFASFLLSLLSFSRWEF